MSDNTRPTAAELAATGDTGALFECIAALAWWPEEREPDEADKDIRLRMILDYARRGVAVTTEERAAVEVK